MPDAPRSFDAEAALRPLKAFQRRTVEYVFRRFYQDAETTKQFLVADEVGLGKTMVARGVIARTIERLWNSVDRIDIVYVCSNQAIAAQNINRLNVLGQEAISLPTRMTLLPLQLRGERNLAQNKVNFISLTPGTTFDLRSSTGVVPERAFIFRLLEGSVDPRRGLYNLLQVGAGDDNWKRIVDDTTLDGIDPKLIDNFRSGVAADAALLEGLRSLCGKFHWRRERYPDDFTTARNALIGKLRSKLSHTCVSALQPDLIIMDEFQRFNELLHGDHDAAILAQELFNYSDQQGNSARTLLLSATPYRMLTLSSDNQEEGDHYRDFLETLSFLFGRDRGKDIARELSLEMGQFRKALLNLPDGKTEAVARRASIETQLRQVIARTERVASTTDQDSMVRELPMPVSVEPEDLRQARAVATIARVADAPEIVEYWKSAPYLLNFMRDYALKDALKSKGRAGNPALVDAIAGARPSCLDRSSLNGYLPLAPANGRMRALIEEVFADSLEQQLWLPPSLPYYARTEGSSARPTKALVFSSWSMVPDAVAAILSYEAERRMGAGETGGGYFDQHTSRPIQFRDTQGRLSNMRALLLFYPSPAIAAGADPLEIVAASPTLPSYEEMRAALARRLQPLLTTLQASADQTAPADTWEWAGPAVLDALAGNRALAWMQQPEGLASLNNEEAYPGHIAELCRAAQSGRVGGVVPGQALELLVDLALGSPAICALRALRRVAPELAWDDPILLTEASRIAWGFRTLYNQRETVALLRRESGERYWHGVIKRAALDNLQAVLDEYVHCLVEAEGLSAAPPPARVQGLGKAIHAVLSLRPSQIEVDDPQIRERKVDVGTFTLRGRFAMRLADYRDDEGTVERFSSVRDAFNSPFRPFVLATTSIGQEGLDFHPYCHRIYHWNLPRNPVDLEQREGRIHRYKSHAVRLNLADAQAAAIRTSITTQEAPADPWATMFAAARAATSLDSDLVPYWICEGATKIERRVPTLPFSSEVARLTWLKKSVAVYRLAFGQPRQDDLLEYLRSLSEHLSTEDLEALQIRLAPPEAATAIKLEAGLSSPTFHATESK